MARLSIKLLFFETATSWIYQYPNTFEELNSYTFWKGHESQLTVKIEYVVPRLKEKGTKLDWKSPHYGVNGKRWVPSLLKPHLRHLLAIGQIT